MALFAPPLRRSLQELRDEPEDRVVRKDVRSADWDGGTDLSSGADTTATKGYFADYSAGAAQFETLFYKGAELGIGKVWTPTYTNITIGNATVTSRVIQDGDRVLAWIEVIFGSSSSMGTGPSISVPVAPKIATDETWVAGLSIIDNGVGRFNGAVRLSDTLDRFLLFVDKVDGTYSTQAAITSTVPMTWTTSDGFGFAATYEAA